MLYKLFSSKHAIFRTSLPRIQISVFHSTIALIRLKITKNSSEVFEPLESTRQPALNCFLLYRAWDRFAQSTSVYSKPKTAFRFRHAERFSL